MADKCFRLTSFAGLSQKGKAHFHVWGNELTVLCVDMQIYIIHTCSKKNMQTRTGGESWLVPHNRAAEICRIWKYHFGQASSKKVKTSVHRISIKRTLMSLSSTKSLEELLCEVKTRRQVGIPRTAIQEERASWPRRLMTGTRCNRTEQD